MWTAGRAFWPFVSPVVAVLAVANLVVARRSPVDYRGWWLAGSAFMPAADVPAVAGRAVRVTALSFSFSRLSLRYRPGLEARTSPRSRPGHGDDTLVSCGCPKLRARPV